MNNLSQSNVQASADVSAQSLLASLKASLNMGGVQEGLFKSLLDETQSTLPEIKIPAPQAKTNITRDLSQRSTSQGASTSDNGDTQSDTRALVSHEPEAAQIKTNKKTDKAEAKERLAARHVAHHEAKQAQKQGKADETASVEQEDETITAAESETLAVTLSDNMPAEVVAAAAGAVADENADETSEPVVTTEGTTDETEQAPDLLAVAEIAPMAWRHRERVAKEGGDAESQTTSDEAKNAIETALGVKADFRNERRGTAGQTEALNTGAVNETADASSETAESKPTLAPTATKSAMDSTLAPVGKEVSGRGNFEQAFLNQGVVPPAQGLAQSSAPQQAASAAVQELAQISESSAAGQTAKSSTPLSTGEGVRPATSYDFASQLSAARATKGGAAGLPKAVEQVALQLHKMVKDGSDEITIQLKPVELGKIEIKLSFSSDNKVQGTVIADHQSTLNLLLKDVGGLQRALQDAGLQADANSLQFSLRGDDQGQGFNQNAKQKHSSMLFDVADSGLDEDALSSLGLDASYVTPGRVNLRV